MLIPVKVYSSIMNADSLDGIVDTIVNAYVDAIRETRRNNVVECNISIDNKKETPKVQQKQTKKNTQSKALRAINARLENFDLGIKNVIVAGQRTIVFFTDGTKTTVQCREGDTYSKEAGIAFAIVKKLLGKYEPGYTEVRGNGYDRLIGEVASEAIAQESIRKSVAEKAKALKAKKADAKETVDKLVGVATGQIPPKVAPEAGNVAQATQDFVK